METGKISEWIKKEGDELVPGDAICGVETDKATVSFEVQDDGYLARIVVPEGTDNVEIGTLVALMVEEEGDIAAAQALDLSAVTASEASPKSGSEAPPSSGASAGASQHAPRAAPAASRLMLQHGLDASTISGTGKHGHITKGDVLRALGLAAPESAASAAPEARAPVATASPTPPQAAGVGIGDALLADDVHSIPVPSLVKNADREGASWNDSKPSTMRKVIAKRLTEAKSGTPTHYTVQSCRLDAMLAHRKSLAAAGVKVSVNDLIISAAAKALRQVPEVNSYFDGDAIVANESVDISVAVATDGGLITPIVKDADKLGLSHIGSSVRDLAKRARKGALAPEEYQGGSFTISNLGMYGIKHFTALINPPQSCILAVGGGVPTPVFPGPVDVDAVLDGAEPPRPETATMMRVQLSADRRVINEATAATFLGAFRSIVENPVLLTS
jgi:pyruvate dehydrogenase E2 component (dihydrolipoamide acetyltransferase)